MLQWWPKKTQKYVIDQKWEIRKHKVFFINTTTFCDGPVIKIRVKNSWSPNQKTKLGNPLDHKQMIKRHELRVMFFSTQRIFCFEKSYLTMFGKNGWNGFSCSKEDMKSPIKLASTTWKLGKLLVLRRRETLEYGAWLSNKTVPCSQFNAGWLKSPSLNFFWGQI